MVMPSCGRDVGTRGPDGKTARPHDNPLERPLLKRPPNGDLCAEARKAFPALRAGSFRATWLFSKCTTLFLTFGSSTTTREKPRMFDDILIESANTRKTRGGWLTVLFSLIIHLSVVGSLLAAGYFAKQHADMIEKPIDAFVVAQAPPPPPPPPAASSSALKTVKFETPKGQKASFVTPTEIPKVTPQPDPTSDVKNENNGVVGGQQGGVEGGVVGGVIGGVVGGRLGGQLGGQLGGTGTGAMRVGGDVLAPEVIQRFDPLYTDPALKARVQGIVILEAIIDATGRVTDV